MDGQEPLVAPPEDVAADGVPPQDVPPGDDEEDEEEEDSEDEDEGDAIQNEGVLEGGVAEEVEDGKPRRRASQGDILLFFHCTEALDLSPEHSVLKAGVTVQIGLVKTSRLSTVFERYVQFCNEQDPEQHVDLQDLEFAHTQILLGCDTAETAALMKNDRIAVRREKSSERQVAELSMRCQRETDKDYFQQLSHLLPKRTSSGRISPHAVDKYADMALDCRGRLPTGNYLEGKTTDTTIKVHSVLIRKRCPWLCQIIDKARQEHMRRSVVTVPEEGKEDEAFDRLQQLKKDDTMQQEASAAAQIENDDESVGDRAPDEGLPNVCQEEGALVDRNESVDTANMVCAVIEDHHVEAVKLLLEYCYTNRALCLGYDAFVKSCKTKPQSKKGPVPPYSLRSSKWPNEGKPTLTLAVALAGIRLAEEAHMHRLSLMCEIAASKLVDLDSAIVTLEMCESQRQRTGNALSQLRNETVELILRGQYHVTGGISVLLKPALEAKGNVLIPPLFSGTMEAMQTSQSSKKSHSSSRGISEKRDWETMTCFFSDKYDRADHMERERERRKRRQGDTKVFALFEDDEDIGHLAERDVRELTFKRMSHHLSGRLANHFKPNNFGAGGNHHRSSYSSEY